MPAFTIRIPADAAAALRDLAQVECRTPRDQAAFLVIQGLRSAAASSAPAVPEPRTRSRPLAAETSADAPQVEP